MTHNDILCKEWASLQKHQSLPDQILPQFDIKHLSVATKLGKLEKKPQNKLGLSWARAKLSCQLNLA